MPNDGMAKAWMTSVGRGDEHAGLVDRHHQLVVDGEQARIFLAVFLAGGGAV
jgi:predicted phage-related endonuclease